MNLKAEAERYFSKLNPIASRIYADFQDTRNSYECIWNTLSFNEQSQILNECIVKPEVSLQYNLKTNDFTGENKNANDSLFGIKRILDENVSYRDEHSAPFSFKTLSQVDLRLFGITEAAHKQVTVTPKIEPPKLQQPKAEIPVTETPTTHYKTETSLFGKLLGRKQSPDAEQEVLVSPLSNRDSSESALPKTGLDFLDNW